LLSATCEGKKHDKKITDETHFTLPAGSLLYQDTGFQGFALAGMTIIQPKKGPRGSQLTAEETERNREVARIRIRVGRVVS
jgi:hypothetical protein